MGLNDQAEKVRQADEWLATEPIGSENYAAAMEFFNADRVERYSRLLSADVMSNAEYMTGLLKYYRGSFWKDLQNRGLVPVTRVRETMEGTSNGEDYCFQLSVPVRKL